jgi:adenosylcobinamide kinase/adenosylcobinamide-phosphate guanylyltransferase
MKIFVTGGCKNGKSYYSQHLAKQQRNSDSGALYYIATMKAADSEDDERIKRHRKDRDGWGFTTIEQRQNIEEILNLCNCDGSFLLDSLTALLANEMFTTTGKVQNNATEIIAKGLLEILNQINNIVIVSDYIYSDAIIYDPLSEEYRKSLAALDRLAAKHCDVVLEVCYSQVITHKGRELHKCNN